MVAIILRALLAGLGGFVALPILAFILVLGAGYLLDSRCGTPGDSGGCEMGAASVALLATVPGFLIGFALTLYRGLRARSRS